MPGLAIRSKSCTAHLRIELTLGEHKRLVGGPGGLLPALLAQRLVLHLRGARLGPLFGRDP